MALVVNGAVRSLAGVDPAQSLASYLRETAGDQSVKLSCASGSCGACTVAVLDGSGALRTLNSCLAPVGSLSSCSVVTAAGVGSSRAGFHAVQERIGAFHASQCGFCTPGFAVAIAAALQRARAEGREVDPAELARSVDGNLCRCTGYRPIADVCSSFGGVDIEDLGLHTPLGAGAGAAGAELPLAVAAACGSSPAPARCNGGAAAPWRMEAGGRMWLAPTSLQQLVEACAAAPPCNGCGPPAPRFLGGNTGAGIFPALWPAADPLVVTLGGVEEMRRVELSEAHLEVGAAVTIAELAAALAAHAGKAPAGAPLAALAALLGRIAGAHVRQAGSVGGNLVLAQCQGLESDLATALLGWGASVSLLDIGGPANGGLHPTELPLADFLGAGRAPAAGQLLVALRLPLPGPADYFWCHKLAEAHSSVHATMNAAVRLSGDGAPPRVVFGFYGASGWVARRAAAAEAALAGGELTPAVLSAALTAVRADVAQAARQAEHAAMAEGLLLQALAPAVRERCAAAGGLPASVERLLQVPPPNEAPPVMRGRQEFDAPPDAAPLGAPFEKERVRLQASGEAQYTVDVPAPRGTLFAAWVTSQRACAAIESVDPSAALALPGVSAFIGGADLPPERNVVSLLCKTPEPVLAAGRVEYHSQPLGIVVADSQAAADAGAAAVAVRYGPAEEPVLSIEAARRRGAFVPLPPMLGGDNLAEGDAAGALSAAPLRLQGSVSMPAVYHMYMEPQNALALPDEGGSMRLHSSCQDIDGVQRSVANALGLRQHDVEVICRRVGGGFGGKALRSLPAAVGAALAAARTGRPVRLVQDRRTDMRLNGGRCETLAEFDVGFTPEGSIQALKIDVFLLLGAFPELPIDAMVIKKLLPLAYRIPNIALSIKQCRANLPPVTAMRAPGDAQAAFIIEQVVEAVAAACGLDPTLVRERNFARPPAAAAEAAAAGATAAGVDAAGAGTPVVRLSLGKELAAEEYTLPALWARLKAGCGYEARRAAAAAFNARSPWVKRGLGMTHTRFDCWVATKSGYVSIFHDASVVVFAGGAELGQGLTTKVKQIALHELGAALPDGSPPLPPEMVRLGDQSSYALPGTNMTGGSTTSESAAIAVRDACQQLARSLRPLAEELGPGCTWAQLIASVLPPGGMGPTKVPLTAYGRTLGGLQYCTFGAACTEAELNVLTGERRLLRSDIVMDVGRSMNPAVDVGQVEGAFSMGLGQCLSEARRVDAATGELLSDSLWHYHPPTAAAMPAVLNVALAPVRAAGPRGRRSRPSLRGRVPGRCALRNLSCVPRRPQNSSLARHVLSAKAVGEPPLMLAASALSALQAAAAAAREELAAVGAIKASAAAPLVQLPATPESLVAALGGAGRDLAAAFAG